MSDFSNEPSSGSMKNRGAILLSITLVAAVLLVAKCNKSNSVDPTKPTEVFSIGVNRDGTLQFDKNGTDPAPKDEELAPILENIRYLLKDRGEEVTAIAIVSKGSITIRVTVWENGVEKHYYITVPMEE